MGAGELTQRLAFEMRPNLSDESPAGDDFGNVEGPFTEQFQCAARRRFRPGREDVQAAALAGIQPVNFRVRASARSRAIDTAWRARDVRSGELFNIRAVAITPDRMWIDLICEAGVAT